MEERDFADEKSLTPELLEANQLTVENIRLWDHRPLLSTYAQLQAIRTYYDFHDVDIDRYTIGGKYRQVMLSARELNYAALPSRTWVNEQLTYTHGYGIVLSPVNRILREGEPDFLLKDIPPVGHSDLKLTRPESITAKPQTLTSSSEPRRENSITRWVTRMNTPTTRATEVCLWAAG